MAVSALTTLLAVKAASVAPGLRPSEIRILVALIEHYRRDTGQCDPSIDRIARLLSYSRRTVFRALNRFVAAGLVTRIRHGGHLNRNQYEPAWGRLLQIEREWNARLWEGAQTRRAAEKHAAGPASHLGDDSRVTQTFLTNLREEAGGKAKRAQPQRLKPKLSSREVVKTVAAKQLADDLHRQFGRDQSLYARVIALVDEHVHARAVDAEQRRRGAGIDYIIDALRLAGIPSTGARGSSRVMAAAGLSHPNDSPCGQSKNKVDEVDNG